MNQLLPLIREIAGKRQVDPLLLQAIILQESAGNSWAWKPEPRYRYLWDLEYNRPFRTLTPQELASKEAPLDFHAPAGVTRETEWWGQQASWGPMQIMGAVARELGFRGSFLSELCDPAQGLEHGCRHFVDLLKRCDGILPKALSAYNGGMGAARQNPFPNRDYVLSVLRHLDQLRKNP